MRVVEKFPEASYVYDLSISLRLIRNHILDRPQREARNVSLLRCNADCVEGECFGCGPGHTAIEFACRVGASGHVHALDVAIAGVQHGGTTRQVGPPFFI